jgi:hypothetical protein
MHSWTARPSRLPVGSRLKTLVGLKITTDRAGMVLTSTQLITSLIWPFRTEYRLANVLPASLFDW